MKRLILRKLRDLAARVSQSRDPDIIIGRTEEPYMYRWFLIPRNRYFNIYLHCFLRPDNDVPHDHPWVSCSVIIRGSYVEHCLSGDGKTLTANKRVEGSVTFRRASAAHRVEIKPGDYVWTIFLTGPKIRTWGFHCPKRWVPWKEFVDPADVGKVGKGCAE